MLEENKNESSCLFLCWPCYTCSLVNVWRWVARNYFEPEIIFLILYILRCYFSLFNKNFSGFLLCVLYIVFKSKTVLEKSTDYCFLKNLYFIEVTQTRKLYSLKSFWIPKYMFKDEFYVFFCWVTHFEKNITLQF